MRGVLGLGDDQPSGDEADEADRDVDVEDPVRADVLRDQATDEWADSERHRGDAGPDAGRGATFLGWECRRDDREGGRHHEGRAYALEQAGTDQQLRISR